MTKVWREVLVTYIFSEVISYGLMRHLGANEILDEFEISDLLRDKYNIQKDYEWYSEDFIGSELDTPTDIRVEDVFSLYTGRIETTL